MSFTVEKLENNRAKLTVTVPAEDFLKALTYAYNKEKGKISIPGFRKGKAPMSVIEKMYGQGIFFEDAANKAINDTYPDVLDECELDIVSRPDINVEQIEKGKDFIYTAEVDLKPEVELGKYKGIEVEKIDTTVSGQDVDEEIDRVRRQNSRKVEVTDRPAKADDTAVIDFEGFVDGEAFEGGKGEDYALTLGSKSFIDGFEDQVIGHGVGDEFDVNVTFPEEYQAEELQGKPAVFKVKIKSLSEQQLPELDEDFVGDVSEFETVDEYKADVRKKLEEKKTKQAEAEKENKVVEKLMETSTMSIPDSMIEMRQEQMLDEFSQRITMQGISMDQYFQFTGMSREMLLEQIKPDAEKRVKSRLVLEAVVAAENIEATDEEVDEELDKMAKSYGMELDKIKEYIGEKGRKDIASDVAVSKAAKLLVENAVEV